MPCHQSHAEEHPRPLAKVAVNLANAVTLIKEAATLAHTPLSGQAALTQAQRWASLLGLVTLTNTTFPGRIKAPILAKTTVNLANAVTLTKKAVTLAKVITLAEDTPFSQRCQGATLPGCGGVPIPTKVAVNLANAVTLTKEAAPRTRLTIMLQRPPSQRWSSEFSTNSVN